MRTLNEMLDFNFNFKMCNLVKFSAFIFGIFEKYTYFSKVNVVVVVLFIPLFESKRKQVLKISLCLFI